MLIQWAFELLMPLFVVVVLATQVIVPALRGTPYFPAWKRRAAHGEAQAAAEELEQEEERLRAARLHREAERVRKMVEMEEDGGQIDDSVAAGIRGVRLRREPKVKGETKCQ